MKSILLAFLSNTAGPCSGGAEQRYFLSEVFYYSLADTKTDESLKVLAAEHYEVKKKRHPQPAAVLLVSERPEVTAVNQRAAQRRSASWMKEKKAWQQSSTVPDNRQLWAAGRFGRAGNLCAKLNLVKWWWRLKSSCGETQAEQFRVQRGKTADLHERIISFSLALPLFGHTCYFLSSIKGNILTSVEQNAV